MGMTEQQPLSPAEAAPPTLSIVIPIFDERGALPGLIAELDEVIDKTDLNSELIFVDDGSTDGSGEYLSELASRRPEVVAIDLGRNVGKSEALAAGFDRSRGGDVVALDGDGQDDFFARDPGVDRVADEGFDVVSGWK